MLRVAVSGVCVISFVVALAGVPARAAIFTVTKQADTSDGACDADCSLREAFIAANATPGTDVINLPAGTYRLTLTGSFENASATGDLDVTDDVELHGAGAPTTVIDGNATDTVIEVRPGAALTVTDLTIQNGAQAFDFGSNPGAGGIYNNGGQLTVRDVTVRNNNSNSDTAGIYSTGTASIVRTLFTDNMGNTTGGLANFGTLTLDQSLLTRNAAGGFGTAFRNVGMATISDTTFVANFGASQENGQLYNFGQLSLIRTMVNGAGSFGLSTPCVFSERGNVVIANSTITNCDVAGIYSLGTLTINNSTITHNGSFSFGNGIVNYGGSATITNSIVAANSGSNCSFGVISGGHNLDDDGSCAFAAPGDLSNVADAGLRSLGDYGGPTLTYALCLGPGLPDPTCTGVSPALEAGSPAVPGSGGGACEATDQRGESRPGGLACDIGAFEVQRCGNGVLDDGEVCDDGANADGDCCSATCTAEPAGGPCPDDGQTCTVDVCDASATCTHPAGNAGIECRSSAGVCDVAEHCDGVSTSCPADLKAMGTVCRPVTGECDLEDLCDGTSNYCAYDSYKDYGTPCTDDGLACTVDMCVFGTCEHYLAYQDTVCRPSTGPCDVAELCNGLSPTCPVDAPAMDGTLCADGVFCNGDERCQGGTCQPGSPPCALACNEDADRCETICPSVAQSGCRTAGQSRLFVKTRNDATKNTFVWRWRKGEATTQGEFGDPVHATDFALCLYGGTTGALLSGSDALVPAGPDWKATSSTGWKYRDATAAFDGIENVVLRGSVRRRAKILVKGSGAALRLPALPIASTDVPLTVQLINGASAPRCWESTFDQAELLRNEATHLKAKAD